MTRKKVLKKMSSKKKTAKKSPAKEPPMAPEQIWKGNPKLEPWLVPIDDVKINPSNARQHSEKDVGATAFSMQDHGQQWPVLVQPEDMVLMAGEGRWLAAKKLGWTYIAALASDIREDGERALFSVRDNRTAELSNWDIPDLSKQLQELSTQFDLPATGLWEGYELMPMLDMDWSPPAPESEPEKSVEPAAAADRPEMGAPLFLTVEQREVVERAVESVRNHEGYEDISEGRAVELICGDFLSGPSPDGEEGDGAEPLSGS